MLEKPNCIVLNIFEIGGQFKFKRDPLVSRWIYTAFLNTQNFETNTNTTDPDTNTNLWIHFHENTNVFDKICHLNYFY
jgi:hypothetical protein